jgi:hypothetical protein
MAKITAKEYQQIREVKIIDVLSKEPMLGDFYKMKKLEGEARGHL